MWCKSVQYITKLLYNNVLLKNKRLINIRIVELVVYYLFVYEYGAFKKWFIC